MVKASGYNIFLLQLEVGRAWFFRAWVGLHTLGLGFVLRAQTFSGLKNWLNMSGFIRAWALLHKWKKVGHCVLCSKKLRPDPPLTTYNPFSNYPFSFTTLLTKICQSTYKHVS
jgi:hypothetical protein